MYNFGVRSREKLGTCHKILEAVAIRALERSPYDFTIVHGWRGKDLQNALQESGASNVRFPNSRHNKTDDPQIEHPDTVSDALDFAPWVDGDIPWNDTHIFACIAGCFFAAANELGAVITWGGDWDSDGSTKDQKLLDWGHIQLEHRG